MLNLHVTYVSMMCAKTNWICSYDLMTEHVFPTIIGGNQGNPTVGFFNSFHCFKQGTDMVPQSDCTVNRLRLKI